MTAPLRRRRALVRLLVLAALAMVFLAVPLPGLQFATRSVGAVTPLTEVAPASTDDLASIRSVSDEPVDAASLVTGGDTDTSRFSAIGLTFDEVPDGPVFLRTFDAEGRPGAWREVAVEEEGPDPGTAEARSARPGTEPVWVGAAHGYEVGLGRADATGTRVVTVHDEVQRVAVDATPLAGALNFAPPMGINPRSSWGARAVTGITYGTTVRMGVVHHSESSNNYSPADVPAILRSIQAFHIDGRGWTDIGYNFVVDKFGGVWEGRDGGIDEPVVGAHAIGFNTNTVGVMVIGSYTATNPTSASLESVSQVIGWKLARHGVNPNSSVTVTSGGGDKYPAGTQVTLPRVVGHGDTSSTSCPGQIRNFLERIRVRSQAWTDWIRAVNRPEGRLESVAVAPGRITASGFAHDPTAAVTRVRLTVDGRSIESATDITRPDIEAQWPAYGSASGYSIPATTVTPGWQRACIWVVDQGGSADDVLLGCQDVVVPDPAGNVPTGSIGGLVAYPGGFTITGSALDPDRSGPLTFDVVLNGTTLRTVGSDDAGTVRADIPGIVGGQALVCLRARNLGPGIDVNVDCRDLTVPGASPRGAAEVVRREGDDLVVWGWAVDDESVAPTFVILVIDGRWNVVWADKAKPGWEDAFPRLGPDHGFSTRFGIGDRPVEVCPVIRNVGLGRDTSLGCRIVK